MGITTKKGDTGKTGLYPGNRLWKDDIRIESIGILDELVSFIGAAKSLIIDAHVKENLETIQRELFIAGHEMTTLSNSTKKLKKRIDETHVAGLEKTMAAIEKTLLLKRFCLPGEDPASSALDIARTVARKAERQCVKLLRKKHLKNIFVIKYLNRLSDLLFLLARKTEKHHRSL